MTGPSHITYTKMNNTKMNIKNHITTHPGLLSGLLLIFFISLVLIGLAGTAAATQPNCLGCHGKFVPELPAPTINTTIFQSSIHNALNGSADNLNRACWACHDSIIYFAHMTNTPPPAKTCEECHAKSSSLSLYSAPVVVEHRPGADDINTSTECITCHANSVNASANYTNNAANVSHAGTKNTLMTPADNSTQCTWCHFDNPTNESWGTPVDPRVNVTSINHSLMTTSAQCHTCHTGGSMPQNFHDASLSANGMPNCVQCHASGLYGVPMVNSTILQNSIHANLNNASADLNYACQACHDGITAFPHPSPPQPKTCEDCHAKSDFLSIYSAPVIVEHRQGGDDINTSSSCVICHANSVDPSANYTNNTANVSHAGTKTSLMTPANRSSECTWCHFDINNSANASWGTPVDPRITVTSINHSVFNTSTECYACHTGNTAPSNFHDASLSGGAGKDCVSCHDIGGWAPLDKQLDISAMNRTSAIHYTLNSNSVGLTLNPSNQRCWACHGDGNGTEAVQPSGHPVNYKTPKVCSNGDCHIINQSQFKEPMIYSHFNNSERVNNPGNLVSDNISTRAGCQDCHDEALEYYTENSPSPLTAVVSHYGSTNNLVDLTDTACTYCHRDDDIDDKTYAQDWGDATDPMDNVSDLTDARKVKKATVATGDSYSLGNGFYFTVDELDLKGGHALLALYRYGSILAKPVVDTGDEYIYSQWWIDDGDEFNQTLVSINTTSVFRGDTSVLAQFEARGIKRLHNDNDAGICMICHTKPLTVSPDKYIVLAHDDDRTYYTSLYADFDDEDSPVRSINIAEGSQWNAGEYSLKMDELDIKGQKARISLYYKDSFVKEDVVQTGDVFEHYTDDITYADYQLDNTTFFTARVTGIFASSDILVATFDNIKAMSLAIIGISDDDQDEEYGNEWVGGYNVSWLRVNDTFILSEKPDTIHSPRLTDGANGGPDCLKCHDIAAGFDIPTVDIMSTRLGVHGELNRNASSITSLSDDINKACWACHGNGEEPEKHLKTIRKTCDDCHRTGLFDAPDLSEVSHGIGAKCNSCHGDKHEVKSLRAGARVASYDVSNMNPVKGDLVNFSVVAASGWGMLIEDVEYFIDEIGDNGTGVRMAAIDGIFDSQTEPAYSIIDTANMDDGPYTIYVHAKQRNRWGSFTKIHIDIGSHLKNVEESETKRLRNIKIAEYLITLLLSGGLAYLIIRYLKLKGKLH